MSKYRAKQTNGRASKREDKRAQDLALLQKLGEIHGLEEQVKYVLVPSQKGERPVTYTADFRYRDKQGKLHVEDSKGYKTQQYIIRRKLMLWVHGIKIEEV